MALAISGQASFLPASQVLRVADAAFAICASGIAGGAQDLEALLNPSAASLPASDFLKKHFFAPSCSPKLQWVHSSVEEQNLAQIPGCSELNLSEFLQSFCQQPAEPNELTSTKIACAPAWRSRA